MATAGAARAGGDLNPRAIVRAQRACDADPAMRVRLAGDTADEPAESFDAILAMAVLRHGELEGGRPENCGAVLRFERSEVALADIDALLKPGGWLAVGQAHFRVRDAAAMADYTGEALPFSARSAGFALQFRTIAGSTASHRHEVLFCKPH